ncbi:MAG: hypothetical protein ACLGIW_18445 [Gammaproteobacteria bacterium]
MKKIACAFAAAAALAGCATGPTAEQLRAQAPSQPDFEVCRAAVLGDRQLSAIAAEEMQRRRLDCSPHMAMIQAQGQAQASRSAMALQLMQMNQPRPTQMQPYIPPPMVNCNSYRYGNNTQTTCQ